MSQFEALSPAALPFFERIPDIIDMKIGSYDIIKRSIMLEPIIGSTNRERVLVFISARESGYAREISRFFDTGLSPIQQQLENLEAGGVLVSRKVGKTLQYRFNPRYPFLAELNALLDKATAFYPEAQLQRLIMNRRRPRRAGKPL
jgi:hypothetical protein